MSHNYRDHKKQNKMLNNLKNQIWDTYDFEKQKKNQ